MTSDFPNSDPIHMEVVLNGNNNNNSMDLTKRNITTSAGINHLIREGGLNVLLQPGVIIH